MPKRIAIKTQIKAPLEKVWELYNSIEHVKRWNNASEDWHTPNAVNDFRVGGNFLYRMEAIDGSSGFDFEGTYNKIVEKNLIAYTMTDGRSVEVKMREEGMKTVVEITFDAESENSIEIQQNGWQSILDNFKNYVENATSR